MCEAEQKVQTLQHQVEALKQMCVERDVRIDGEWGNGTATTEELRADIEAELAQRMRQHTICGACPHGHEDHDNLGTECFRCDCTGWIQREWSDT